MNELKILVDNLKKHYAAKELELRKHPSFNTYTEGALLNRQYDIENFQFASEKCDTHPLLKRQIIKNFKNEAVKIKSEIDKISCSH